MTPPKPSSRAEKVSLWRYMRLFREDILSAQPEKLYRAWMAEFKTPFFRSYLANDPELINLVLRDRPDDFPKSDRVGSGLRPLLGNSVFLTNGEEWRRQRRIIDPAFEGGRLKDTYAAIYAAGEAAVERLRSKSDGVDFDIEPETSHVAADVIFRTLFSVSIKDETASQVFEQFQTYQRTQPILNLGAFIRGPKWMPRFYRRGTKSNAKAIRALIEVMTRERGKAIAAGTAPNDLATKIMTTEDPETGETFSTSEMVDQIAIFFLAGHETSASALAWALYLLATHPEWQEKVAAEAGLLTNEFASLSKLKETRDVFREALRLYPPVPMMVREATRPETFRNRKVRRGSQIVLSPWHLQRHTRFWERPDDFDPQRWTSENGKRCAREAYMPFSAGPRVCTGAGFAMIEGVVLLAQLVRAYKIEPVVGKEPVPVAHLTVRSADGIYLRFATRG